MSLSVQMENQGQWLFRWRSYLPFAFVPCLIWQVMHSPHDTTDWLWHGVWPIACWFLSLSGLLIRMHCVGHAAPNTSGRNTRSQIADSLNVTGMYSVVRHPLYLGNFLIALGIVAHPASFWLIALFILAFFVYYERIMFAEEAFLTRKFDRVFTDWARQTPLFLPSFGHWVAPALPFNLRKACRQETAAIAVITSGFLLLELGSHASSGTMESLELWWWVSSLAGVLLYGVLQILKRYERSRQRSLRALMELSFIGSSALVSPDSVQWIVDQMEAGSTTNSW